MIINCSICEKEFNRKPSEINKYNFCNKECYKIHKTNITNSPIIRLMKIYKTKWAAINIRCGKYKHIQTENKCKSYKNISIKFDREQFKNYCLQNIEHILSLKRPSIDRINKEKDYSLDNIQFIELSENIRKEKLVSKDGFCICCVCKNKKNIEEFCKDKRRINGYTTMCKVCENERNKLKYKKKNGTI